jgi:hypothetical protein
MIKYWSKIANSENPLIKAIYIMMTNDAKNGCTYGSLNYAYQVKTLLQKNGLMHIWISQRIDRYAVLQTTERIKDIYKQTWCAYINESNRLSLYCIYKHILEMDKYLIYNIETKYQLILTKFRLYANNLSIETGRYINIEREMRICTQCNMKVVEDQYHFLLVCPKYRDLRQRYFKHYFCVFPTKQKFIGLMASQNRNMLLNIGKYLLNAFKIRNPI